MEQCRLLPGGGGWWEYGPYPVPVVDVHLFPVRPQRVHHLGVPRSYRQNQCRVSILSISKRDRVNDNLTYLVYDEADAIQGTQLSDFSPCWGRWCRPRKTGGSPWPPRGGSVWPALAGYCRPVTHIERVQSIYAFIIIISLLPVYALKTTFTGMPFIIISSVLPVNAFIIIKWNFLSLTI